MFVDVVPNRNSRPTILIRQAYREGGKAKKRTLANITKLPPDAVALVAQRILEPGSKLAAARLFRPETAVSTLSSQLGLPVNAEVKFPKSAEVKFPTFWCFGGEPDQSSVRVSFLGRPRFFGAGGGVMGAFARTCSGMRSACFLSL